jgi:hypothetical protein
MPDENGEELTAPPIQDQEPAGIAEAREWAAAEQVKILAMDFPPDIDAAWKAMTEHELGRRLIAYEPVVMTAIKAAVKAHKAALASAKP